MLELVGIGAPFFMVIMLGFLAGRLGVFRLDSAKVFNNYLLYFALPAMFLSKLLEQDVLSGFDVRVMVVFMLANTTILVLSWIIHGGLYRLSLGDTAALGTTSAWGNSGYMGIPRWNCSAVPGFSSPFPCSLPISSSFRLPDLPCTRSTRTGAKTPAAAAVVAWASPRWGGHCARPCAASPPTRS